MPPLYDYECQACDHKDEIIVDVDSTGLRKCPECGAKQYKRQITGGTGVHFKGKDFPGNDHRGKWHLRD